MPSVRRAHKRLAEHGMHSLPVGNGVDGRTNASKQTTRCDTGPVQPLAVEQQRHLLRLSVHSGARVLVIGASGGRAHRPNS